MKLMSTITIGLATAALLLVGCGEAKEEAMPVKEAVKAKVAPISFVTEKSLGLRETDLYSEEFNTHGHKAGYSTTYAGSGHKIKRAFQDAPPMVPHDTEGMLPITIKDNQCIGCHMPEVASSMGATPIPSSHFLNMRPKHNFDGKMFTKAIDNMKNETSIKSNGSKLYGGRFNCSQCHAPQSGDDVSVKNTFEADFTSPDGESKSSWNGSTLLEGLDTSNGL